jgi:hypothetical protein
MKTRTIVIIVFLACGGLFAVLIAAVAAFFFLGFTHTDADLSPRIDAMFAAMENDTFGETYATETAPELRAGQSREQYEQVGRMVKARLGGLRSKKLTQWNVRYFNADAFADVAYAATFEKGPGTIQARFKKVNGQWRIVSFKVDSPEFQKDMATGKCPHCGEPHAAAAKFCPKCGKALSAGETKL